MLKDIFSIEILSPYFANPTKLELFKTNKRASIIFGRNGSGKSTIAKAFKYIKEGDTSINSAKIYGGNNKEISLSDTEKNQLWIFDEDYILQNIKFKEFGLDTIVMLGNSVELSDKIDEAKKRQNDEKDKYDLALTNHEAMYNDPQSVNSPEYYLNKMVSALKGDGNWADRDKKIKNTKINTPVNQNTYKQFERLNPQENRDTLLKHFECLLQQLELSRNNSITKITTPIPNIEKNYTEYEGEKISELLKVQIENPVLSEREKHLLHLLQMGESSFFNKIHETFNNDATEKCPFCYQPVNRKYKADLVKSIEKILNDEVKKHKNELSNYNLTKLNINLVDFKELDNYEKCTDLVSKINLEIEKINGIIKKKSDNPYTPISEDLPSISTLALQLQTELQQLEIDKTRYNESFSNEDLIKQKLLKINNEIAYLDIKEHLKNYKQQYSKKITSSNKLKLMLESYQTASKEVSDLQAQLSNIKIAVDEINEGLKYIFFSDDRLQITCEQNSYKLMSRGNPVNPKDISIGERNIMALCYFFTKIIQKKEKNSVYNNDYLLVLDDPISSFDYENKIGVLSYLKYKLSQFLGNTNSKVIILTHDITTLYDLQKTFKGIFTDIIGKKAQELAIFELKDKNTSLFELKNNCGEYTKLINIIFSFANGSSNENSIVIGNIMRQVLEAFTTFQYQKGFDEVLSKKELDVIMNSNQKFIPYFNCLMSRLLLHGGSHRQEQVYSMRDYNFLELISPSEKIRTAKDILCFIFLINPQHMLHHIQNNNAEKMLKEWCNEIEKRLK